MPITPNGPSGYNGGYTCTGCGVWVSWGVNHHCAAQGVTWMKVGAPSIYERIEELLKRLIELYETPIEETSVELTTLESSGPERPLVLHFKGRSIPNLQVDSVRTQLDDYVSGKDTRPLVINYDGEVKWIPEPEAS